MYQHQVLNTEHQDLTPQREEGTWPSGGLRSAGGMVGLKIRGFFPLFNEYMKSTFYSILAD